jgi:hypothetical protein
MNLTIHNFANPNKKINKEYLCISHGGNNICPKMSWNCVENAKSYVIIMEDPDAVVSNFIQFENINKHYIGRYFGIESNDIRLTDINSNNMLKCFVSQQKGFVKYIDKKYMTKDFKYWKVITTRSSHKGSSGFGNIFIGNINDVHTGSYISFKFLTELEALSFESYLKCKLPNFFLSLRKSTQDISENVCKWIPLPILDRIWNNNDLYQYFNLSNEHIELINNTKIIGFNDNNDDKSISSKSTKSTKSTKSSTDEVILCNAPLKKKGETCKNKANPQCDGKCKRHFVVVV